MTRMAVDDAGAGAGGWRPMLWVTIALLLLLPMVAMRFTEEVAWTAGDFAAAAVLLVGAGAIYEVAMRRPRAAKHRTMIGAGLVAAVALVWAEGAVGIF